MWGDLFARGDRPTQLESFVVVGVKLDLIDVVSLGTKLRMTPAPQWLPAEPYELAERDAEHKLLLRLVKESPWDLVMQGETIGCDRKLAAGERVPMGAMTTVV